MTPWQDGDSFRVVAANAGAASIEARSGTPAVNDTAVSALTFDWAGQPLVRASLGDSLRLVHVTSRPIARGLTAQVIADQVVSSTIEQVDAAPTALAGSFALLPASSSTTVDWRLGELTAALETAGGPEYARTRSEFLILPGQTLFLPLLTITSDLETDLDLGAVNFGNPFPGIPGPYRWITVRREVVYEIPGAAPSTFVDGHSPGITIRESLADASGEVRPLIHPPIDVRMNGQLLDEVPPAISVSVPLDESVVVTWQANPASASPPAAYMTRIFILSRSNAGATDRRRVMSIGTRSPGFTVPPGILEAGRSYCLLVTSQYNPGRDESVPRRYTVPSSEAQIATGIFSTYDPDLPDAGTGGGGRLPREELP
jgi:hypothetical protein